MKKIISVLAAVALMFSFVTGMEAKAADASGKLTGPSTAKAGETITLNLNVNSTVCYGASGEVSCDTSGVVINSVTAGISGWTVSYENPMFTLIDMSGNGAGGSQTIVKISVTLPSGLKASDNILV